MRLTLRTLLAYLDDTLDPTQAKQIGQKVAESEVAQELIERIKKVTRRRKLTVPPADGPESYDANIVAEYLDNDLPGDKVAEVEDTALHSDVHLAEIAACHQILTLVLGEPARVPPTARQRMYELNKGRESVKRKPPAARVPAAVEAPARSALGYWPFAVAGLLAVGIGFALYMAINTAPRPTPAGPPSTVVADAGSRPNVEPVVEPGKEPTKEPVKEPVKEPAKEPTKAAEPPKEPAKEPA